MQHAGRVGQVARTEIQFMKVAETLKLLRKRELTNHNFGFQSSMFKGILRVQVVETLVLAERSGRTGLHVQSNGTACCRSTQLGILRSPQEKSSPARSRGSQHRQEGRLEIGKKSPRDRIGCGSKLHRRGYAGFGPCFHSPGFHFGIPVC